MEQQPLLQLTDFLTSYDVQAITYDEIGNTLSFGSKTFAWEGRQLVALSDSGSGASLTYQYDDSGIRTQKTYNGVTTSYYLNGSDVVRETNGTDTLDYFYDADGNLYGFKLDGNEYYYTRNGQNDIIGILDTSGSEVVSYSYDTWGKLLGITGSLADTVGVMNPYRYRGYRYDTETGLYSLHSRYYDPMTGRFINADSVVSGTGGSVQGYNLFAYCMNNPVNMSDESGHWPKWLSGALTIVSGVSQVIAGAALGATVGWTGIGAVLATALVLNGAATVGSGIGQIVNSATKKQTLPEENIIRTGAKVTGKAIGGKTGEKVGAAIYDVGNVAATVYSIGGGGATALSKTASALGKTTTITKQSFSMLPKSMFTNEYAVDIGMTMTKYINLPKPWFRAVNGIGAVTDGTLTLINIFGDDN